MLKCDFDTVREGLELERHLVIPKQVPQMVVLGEASADELAFLRWIYGSPLPRIMGMWEM